MAFLFPYFIVSDYNSLWKELGTHYHVHCHGVGRVLLPEDVASLSINGNPGVKLLECQES